MTNDARRMKYAHYIHVSDLITPDQKCSLYTQYVRKTRKSENKWNMEANRNWWWWWLCVRHLADGLERSHHLSFVSWRN